MVSEARKYLTKNLPLADKLPREAAALAAALVSLNRHVEGVEEYLKAAEIVQRTPAKGPDVLVGLETSAHPRRS